MLFVYQLLFYKRKYPSKEEIQMLAEKISTTQEKI